MNIKRTMVAVTLSLATAFGLAGCSNDSGDVASTSATGTTQTAERDGKSAAALTVTDAAGRTVEFDEQPERIVLGEGRGAFATAVLQDDPFDKVVAYGEDLKKAAPAFQEKMFDKYPDAKDMPMIGSIQKGDVTVENLLAQNPDVVVMTLDQKKATEQSGFLSDMDRAGIKYVFTDFRQKPLEHTTVSMTLLGDLFGQPEKAKKFNEFYDNKVAEITDRVAKTTERPGTVVWTAAGFTDCCGIAGDTNLGTLVTAAGGRNLGPDILSADSKTVTVEKLVELDPERLIVTGGEWARDPSKTDAFRHVEMGYQADPAMAKETFNSPLQTPGIELLNAPKNGHYYAVYHQFYDNPFNVYALEAFAKWLHPEQFADMDPAKDFEQFHKDWLPYDYSGTFFLDQES